MSNFVSKENADSLFGKVGERLELRPKTWTGSHHDWDNLDPSEQAKYEYVNFNDDYTSGGGASLGMIADNFDENLGYSIGDVVIYEENLYRFGAAHTAGDPWDPTEVTQTTVETEIANVKSEIPTNLGTASTKNYTDSIQPGNMNVPLADAVANAITNAMTSIYMPRGEKACADLTQALLVDANIGSVYEMSDSGTTTALFLQGAGHTISHGDNVGVIKEGNTIYFNLMGNAFDLHDYQKQELTTPIAGQYTVEDTLEYLNTNKQPKTLATALNIEGATKTTVESALSELVNNMDSKARIDISGYLDTNYWGLREYLTIKRIGQRTYILDIGGIQPKTSGTLNLLKSTFPYVFANRFVVCLISDDVANVYHHACLYNNISHNGASVHVPTQCAGQYLYGQAIFTTT